MEYVPAGQGEHVVAPASANIPALHGVHEVIPVVDVEYFPGSQFTHTTDPATLEYFPTGQFEQTLPAVDVFPAAQLVHELAPPKPAVSVPAGHGRQVADWVIGAYVFVPHGRQLLAPADAAYEPDRHAMQADALFPEYLPTVH